MEKNNNCYYLKFLLFEFCIITNSYCVNIKKNEKDYLSNSAYFYSKDGHLIIQSARSSNVTLHLTGNSYFLINNINILDAIKNFESSTPPGESSLTLSSLENTVLKSEILNLEQGVGRIEIRLRQVENRTSSARIIRIRSRIRALENRVNLIEAKIKENECESNPCKNGGICVDLYNNFHCYCPSNWEGKACDVDVNECFEFSGTDLGCQNNALCINTAGGYRCECTSGWVGLHCNRRNIDCATSSLELCGHGVCVTAANNFGYSCICDAGWISTNFTPACTVDIDECTENKHHCISSCINLPGSYICGPCSNGYTGNGMSCTDIDECAFYNGGCSLTPKVNCINTEGSYKCSSCPVGWSGDGTSCFRVELNSCTSSNVCYPSASCQYISGTVVCTCPYGLTGHGFGEFGCAPITNACELHPCKNGGTCVINGSSYTCVCSPGFSQPNCDHYRDICNPNPCQNGGRCVPRLLFTSFSCICPSNYGGLICNQTVNACGGIRQQKSGILKYPLYGNYEPNVRCAWVFKTDENKVFNITFMKFDLKEKDHIDDECNKDWLQIHDGRSSAAVKVGRFCGTTLPKGGNFVSSHNQLYLWFRSDSNIGRSGFVLHWNSTDPLCGGFLETESHGVIKSPGWPGKSSPNRNCEWVIQVPLTKRIHLAFFDVIMGNRPLCEGDYLSIIDGKYAYGEIVEKFCETTNPQPIYSSSDVVTIEFHTDDNSYDSSFQLHYSVVESNPACGGYFTDRSGRFSSPTVTSTSIRKLICHFIIRVPEGTKIEINFPVVQSSLITCYVSFIEIYDGKSEEDPLMRRFCNSDNAPEIIISTSNYLLIKHQSNTLTSSRLFAKFEAEYKMICDFTFTEIVGIIQSPCYPNKCLPDLRCIYKIEVPANNLIIINKEVFDLSKRHINNDNCTSDYLAIYYNILKHENLRDIYCKEFPSIYVAKTNHLYLEFITSDTSRALKGFKFTYEVRNIGCGGVYKDPSGFIFLPGNKSLYAECEWIISASEGYSIYLEFQNFYLPHITKCTTDFLKIFTNGTTSSELVGTYCGNNKPPSVFYSANIVTLRLQLSNSNIGSSYGFRAKYKAMDGYTSCGGNYTSSSGNINSPGWPNRYLPDKECTWVINAPLGVQIELSVKFFELEGLECRYDYLEIRNGFNDQAPLLGRYCEKFIPTRIVSFTNHLWIYFRSDSSDEYSGFLINWYHASSGCGGKLTSYRGAVQSPHYPDIVSDIAECEWQIYVSKGSTINLNITAISPYTDICKTSFLTLFDGPNTLSAKLTLNCTPSGTLENVKSSSNTVIVRFITSNGGSGAFFLSYEMNCHQQLYENNGVIESPNFPDIYPNLISCEWQVIGFKNNKISVAFSHIDLEDQEYGCDYDTLQIEDIKNNETLKVHKICKFPDIITSDGDTIIIKFKTDVSNGASGFRMEYRIEGCGGVLKNNNGLLVSQHLPYSVDTYCRWIIEAPVGRVVELVIEEVHFDNTVKDCNENFLVISDDKDTRNVLLRICETEATNHVVSSTGTKLFVQFYTNAVRERKFVRASYRFTNSKCGGNIRGINGHIVSPNYPNTYVPNLYCEWKVSTEPYHHVELTFVDLNIETSKNCELDYVEITDDNNKETTVKKRYCGNILPVPNKIRSENEAMLVTFKSNNSTEFSGFNLHYQRNCGKDIVIGFDVGYISKGFNDKDCIWTLRSKEIGAHITLNFNHVQCHCDGSSPKDCEQQKGIQVYEGDSIQSLLISSFCTHHPPTIISSGDSLSILGKTGYFEAFYSVYENSCGGNIKSLRGRFSSPRYPNSYPVNIECVWNLKAESGNFISVDIDVMDIFKSDNCNEDYLEVREKNEMGKILGIFCGSKPLGTLTAYENMWIKFKSDDDGVGTGFLASWEYVHNNEISGTEGRIKSPPLESIREDMEDFSWRVLVPRGNVVTLVLQEYNIGLRIYDGYDETAPEMEIQNSPSELITHTNAIYISANNKNLQQFVIEWRALSKTDISRNATDGFCKNQIIILSNYSYVNISSPGYPYGYESELDCEWIIKTNNSAVHAAAILRDVDLENVTNCAADYVAIYSSNNLVDWKLERKECSLPKRYISNLIHGTPFMKINFHSDMSENRTGFMAYLVPVCGGTMTDRRGIINGHTGSAVIHVDVMNCSWSIHVRPGRKIQFEFNEMKIPAKSNGVCDSYVSIRDGIDEHSPHLGLGRFCETADTLNIPLTTSCRAYVIFSFSQFDHLQWELSYKEISEDCGDTIWLTNEKRLINITSPNYPNIPQPHTECRWIIIGPPDETLQLEFVDLFDLLPRIDCPDEYVEIRDGSTILSPQIGRFCRKPNPITSTGNGLYIKFSTEISDPRNGFKATISTSKCGGVYIHTSGQITSTNYPNVGAYPSYSVCNYTIKSVRSARINIVFDDINLPLLQNLNESDHLTVYSIQNQRQEQEIITIYNNNTIPNIEIEADEILIRFYSYKQNIRYRGFKISYTRKLGLCGGLLNKESGDIILNKNFSNLPLRYTMTCRWRIQAPKGRRVTVQILSIEKTSEIINGTYQLSFYNDFFGVSEIINRDSSAKYLSTDNLMLIIFKKFLNSTFVAAKLNYSTFSLSQCPKEINDGHGIILPPEQLNINYFCTLKFTVNGSETIAFHIKSLTSSPVKHARLSPVKFLTYNMRAFTELYGNQSNINVAISVSGSLEMMQVLSSSNIIKTTFEIKYKRNPCGGVYQFNDNFTISLPTNLSNTYGKIDCAWQLRKVYTSSFNLTGKFNLVTRDCKKEYLAIYSGATPMETEIKHICSGDTNFTYIGSRSYMYIHYHADKYSPQSEIEIYANPTSNCGGIINFRLNNVLNHQRDIQFSNKDYKNNQECIWEYNSKEGFTTEIEFYDRFFIEESTDCKKDYLDILRYVDDNWKILIHTCGRLLPQKINTTSTKLRIIFRSDENNVGDGFNIHFKSYCGGIYEVTDDVRTLSLTEYYSYRLECNYTFTSKSDELILISLNEFELDSSDSCAYANMEVYRESPSYYSSEPRLVGKFCKKDDIKDIRGKKRIVLYINGYSIGDLPKFKIEYRHERCGGKITKPEEIQVIANKKDFSYMEELNCVWYIHAPQTYEISIKFKYLNINENYNCNSDYIAVYSKNVTGGDHLKARLCGNLTRDKIRIKINTNTGMIVRKSDSLIDNAGFIALIDFVENCDQSIYISANNSSYHFTRFHGSYTNKLDCHYVFESPNDYSLKLEFHHFNITPCEENENENVNDDNYCKCDYVEIRDGDTPFSELIGDYCGLRIPSPHISMSNKLFIRFVTDDALTGTGFDAHLHLVTSDCGKRDYKVDEKAVKIQFPLVGETYPPNTVCTWMLTPLSKINLHFEFFDLESQSEVTSKCVDYLEVLAIASYGYQNKNRFCGPNVPHDMYFSTDDGQVELRFKSNAEIQRKGFILIARKSNVCANNYTTLSSRIYSYEDNEECEIFVKVPEYFTLTFYIQNMYFYRNCSDEYIEFFDEKTLKQIAKICTTDGHRTNVYANTSFVKVKLKNPTSIDMIYVASQNGSGCGGKLVDSSGTFSSPMYPNSERKNINCRWDIHVPNNKLITLFFEEFDMGSKNTCATDYLQIIEIQQKGRENIVNQFCGEDNPSYFEANTNNVAIIFNKTVNFDGSGWVLRYISRNHHKKFDMGSKNTCATDYLQIIEIQQKGRENIVNQFCGEDNPSYFEANTNNVAIIFNKTVNFDGSGWVLRYISRNHHKKFDMGSKNTCATDYLQIIEIQQKGRENIVNQFCGEDNPSYFEANTNNVAIIFNKTVNFDGSGWVLRYISRNHHKSIVT